MKKILINRHNSGFYTALVDNGKLIEFIIDPTFGGSIVGNIYSGIIKKINTGFIFADIGLEKQAFIDSRDNREKGLFNGGKLTVKQGDALVVQILKDAVGEKGPVATSNISATGRFAVVSKSIEADAINFSRKLDSDERNRLGNIFKSIMMPGFSFIIRSDAAGRNAEEISQEMTNLLSQFNERATARQKSVKPPAALHVTPPILKTVAEIAASDIDEILTDDAETHALLLEFFCPIFTDFKTKARLFSENDHIFDHFFIKTQIAKLNDKKVWLKSGAFIMIEKTEACVTIDVNSGKSGGKSGGDTKLKVNLEAAKEIAYQLRLRNLSGIVIIDFLHMKSKDDIESLTEFLRAELAKDRISAICVGMTALGLMEVTRKRSRN